ncbi:MAG: CIA30 family protein [Bacteroidetes bacterium]|nr:CIA30 family protein [Bacteroidota bacterium]
MKQIIILVLLMTTMNETAYKIDFGKNLDGKNWVVVNDGVMGGKSESTVQLLSNSILFKGNISLRNNGGFASLRNEGDKLDITQYKTVTIKFKTNTNRKFSFRLSNSDWFYKPFFKHEFGSSTPDWETATLPLTDFKEFTIEGETGNKLTSVNMKKEMRIGIILYDKQEGSFEIEIDYIAFN